jgi:RNA polymerase sigma-70 factor (ECF subfamily)
MSGPRAEEVLDELLVLRCQAGDRWAAERLAQRWHPRLLRHAWRLTGEAEAAADAVQEAWVAIVRGLGRLDDTARFRAWAYRITGNKCRDWIRRRRRTRRVRERLAREPRPRAVEEEPAASEERAERRLARALEALPAERRALLAMFYSEGLSVREISAALDIAVGTVKSRLFHGRRDLRRCLEETS